MIISFKERVLQECFENNDCKKLKQDIRIRVLRKLDMLNAAEELDDLSSPPGNRLHELSGDRKGTYAIAVNGPWRITFRFEDGDAFDVALEQYH